MVLDKLLPPSHIGLILDVGASLKRVVLPGWTIRRMNAMTWEISFAKEPSSTWVFFYTVIAMASPRGVLVLHGNVEQRDSDWPKSFRQGKWMPEVWSWGAFKHAIEYESLDEYLSAQLCECPPSIRSVKGPSRDGLERSGDSIEAAVEYQFNLYMDSLGFRIVRHKDERDRYRLIPKEERQGSLHFDYIIYMTEEPEGVLVICEGKDDSDSFILSRCESVVYLTPEELHLNWLPWVLRHKDPNGYGY